MSRVHPPALLGLLLLGAVASAQDSPGQRGQALRAKLAERGPSSSLAGKVQLRARIGAQRAGSVELETQLVEREGETIYRLRDRLRFDLEELGRASLLLEADLRADFSPLRIVLSGEEPRGRGAPLRWRIELRREGQEWARYQARADAPPERSVVELGERPLVLTPPLGAGERLARLAPAELGARYSIAGHDLETGLGARWRLGVDEESELQLGEERVRGHRLRARAAGASYALLRQGGEVGAPLELSLGRLRFRDPRLGKSAPLASTPQAALCSFLRALGAQDREGVQRWLDLEALFAELGGEASDAAGRERFVRVALERLLGAKRGQDRGARLLLASEPRDLEGELEGKRARVWVRGRPALAFVLERRDERWRVIRLPESK